MESNVYKIRYLIYHKISPKLMYLPELFPYLIHPVTDCLRTKWDLKTTLCCPHKISRIGEFFCTKFAPFHAKLFCELLRTKRNNFCPIIRIIPHNTQQVLRNLRKNQIAKKFCAKSKLAQNSLRSKTKIAQKTRFI